MQTEAISRAREMYRRSQSYNAGTFPGGYSGTAGTSAVKHTQRQPSSPNGRSGTTTAVRENSPTAPPQTDTPVPPTTSSPTQQTPPPTAATTATTAATATARESAAQAVPPVRNSAQPQQGGCAGTAAESDFWEPLMSDKERTLIILLIAFLCGESSDTPIVLALMYLLM